MNIFKWFRKASSRSSRSGSKPSRPRRVRLEVESLEERLTPYAVSGNAWAHPELITVSFVPDGTLVNGIASNLQATFNTKFGSAATWQNVFKEAAQVWAQQTNINFNFVADTGAATGSGNYQQGNTEFGDIRIGGYNFGNTTLAQAFLPPQVNNYSIAGDIAFNTGQTFNIGSAYNLFTVAAHEFGHALGLYHGAVGAIMGSAYPGTVTALKTDDISGIRNIYSANAVRAKDSYDAAAANETLATATLVTSSIDTTTKAGVINGRDLSTSTDIDWYKFVIPSGSATTLKVKAVATGLSMLDPKIEIYDSAKKLKATGNGGSWGSIASAQYTVAAGQTWYVKVYSADAKAAFKTGKYSLILNMGTGSDPAVTYPNTQTANGSPLTSGGGIAVQNSWETRVNTTTAGNQALSADTQPSVAMDAAGNYVLVWSSSDQDGSGWGVYAQRYNTSGVAQGGEFRVNTTTTDDQMYPSVATRPNGDFLVTWSSKSQDGTGSWSVYAQRYNAAGVAQGGEFRVNTASLDDQMYPVAAVSVSGDFVITWSSKNQDGNGWGVYAQRYNASGVAQGGEFCVNTTTANDQMNSVVAMDNSGSFAIGWSSSGQDGSGWGVYAQRYNASGVAQGGEFRVNTATAGDQFITRVALDKSGNIVLVWTSAGQDSSGLGIYAQRYNASGVAQGGEFRVNTTTTGDQTTPAIAMDNTGNFVVTWASGGQDGGGWGVCAQQFTKYGTAIESEFRVNSTTAGDQVSPSVAMDSMGHFFVAWSGNGDGDPDGVFLQRYSVSTVAESPPVGDAWDPEGNDHDHEEYGQLGISPAGLSKLGTNRAVDARLHSGSLTDFFSALFGSSILTGNFFGSNNNPNSTGSGGSVLTSAGTAALDLYFSRGHGESELRAAFDFAASGGMDGETVHDEVFAWLAATGENDLGDAVTDGLRKKVKA